MVRERSRAALVRQGASWPAIAGLRHRDGCKAHVAARVGLDVPGAIRRARRRLDYSQRDLARRLEVSNGTVARWEMPGERVSVATLQEILGLAGMQLVVVDAAGQAVRRMRPDAARDAAGRRFAAHLDTRAPDSEDHAEALARARDVPLVTFSHRSTRDRRRVWGAFVPLDHITQETADRAERRRQHTFLERRREMEERRRANRRHVEYVPCFCGEECEGYCDPSCECQCEPSDGQLQFIGKLYSLNEHRERRRLEHEKWLAGPGSSADPGTMTEPLSDEAMALREAYDQQLRLDAEVPSAIEHEVEGGILRAIYPGGVGFVSYRTLEPYPEEDLPKLVAYTLVQFEERVSELEWKTRGHDFAPGLHETLVAHGFEPGEPESVMIGRAELLAAPVEVPEGVTIRRAASRRDLERACAAADAIFDRPAPGMLEALLERFEHDPDSVEMWIAEADGQVIGTGRLELCPGTEFAGIWGGAVRAAWRGKGIYRALTAARARVALDRGATYLHSDSTEYSRPILERSGMVRVTTTTPYVWKNPTG